MDHLPNYLRRDPSHIKEDMRRTAGSLWGADSVTPDQMDPVVDLLFGAFAQEVFAVQQDVLEHRRRMLEMSVQALLPQELSCARPAHAIMHGRPTDSNTYTHRSRTSLSTSHGMDVHDRIGRRFVFTPTDEFRLHRGGVLFLAHADKLYAIDRKTGIRRTIGHAEGRPMTPYEYWIGLELSEPIDPVHGLPLFFTLPSGDPDEWSLLMHLPAARFSVGGRAILAVPGLAPRTTGEPSFDRISDPVNAAEDEATGYYQHKFLTLRVPDDAPGILNTPMPLPTEFKGRFGKDALEEVANAPIWLRMSFPTISDTKVLKNLQCAVNCFPAINRERQERTEARTSLVVLPLGQDEQFWAVDEVKDAKGALVAHERRSVSPVTGGGLTYALRRGGLERLDKREAYEHLMDLLHTVRNDHAAFAALNENELAEGLLKVKAWLEEYRTHPKRPSFPPVYLLFNTIPSGNVHVDYWTTAGAAAMKLPALKPFRLDMGAYMNDVRSMTVPIGGEDTPLSASLTDRLRQVLTKGQADMPTLHSARVHAIAALPEHLRSSVRISAAKEVVMGQRMNDGLQQALVITINVQREADDDLSGWDAISEHVRIVLNDRFKGLLPVHVRSSWAK